MSHSLPPSNHPASPNKNNNHTHHSPPESFTGDPQQHQKFPYKRHNPHSATNLYSGNHQFISEMHRGGAASQSQQQHHVHQRQHFSLGNGVGGIGGNSLQHRQQELNGYTPAFQGMGSLILPPRSSLLGDGVGFGTIVNDSIGDEETQPLQTPSAGEEQVRNWTSIQNAASTGNANVQASQPDLKPPPGHHTQQRSVKKPPQPAPTSSLPASAPPISTTTSANTTSQKTRRKRKRQQKAPLLSKNLSKSVKRRQKMQESDSDSDRDEPRQRRKRKLLPMRFDEMTQKVNTFSLVKVHQRGE